MRDKIKSSNLFKKLMVNSQFALASEDNQLIANLVNSGGSMDNIQAHKDMSMYIEYLRRSSIKSTILTLVDLDVIEEDCDLLDIETTNKLVQEAMEMFVEKKKKK